MKQMDGLSIKHTVHSHNSHDLNEISKLCTASMVVIDFMFDYKMFVASSLILLLAAIPMIKSLANM